MSKWRRRALELFPDLKSELNSPDYTVYSLYVDLLPAVIEAHRAGNDDRLSAIYGYAAWCARSSAKDLWNAAGVSFYEHLFDEKWRWMWEAVPSWLPADIRSDCMGLWEMQLSARDFATVTKLLKAIPPDRLESHQGRAFAARASRDIWRR